MADATRMHWLRIVLGALLLEVVLFAVLVPLDPLFGETVFFVSVPIGCFVFGYAVTFWLLRPLTSEFLLHGALVGLLATAMYLGLATGAPGGIPAAVALYGPPLFWLSQGLRIAGCVAGAAHQERRKRLHADSTR